MKRSSPFPLLARRRICVVAMTCAVAATAPAVSAVDTYTIDGHVIAAGAIQQHSNSCFTLSATVGQAAIGGAFTSTNYTIYAGYWRANPPDADGVFASSFENCGS